MVIIIFLQKSANLSEDTLWEVVTSWQDALSSRDIHMDNELLKKCAEIIHASVSSTIDDETLVEGLEAYAEIVSKLILCSIEFHDESDDQKYEYADHLISTIFQYFQNNFESGLAKTYEMCSFIESINGNLITDSTAQSLTIAFGAIESEDVITELFKETIFKFRVISKMTCNIKENRKSLDITVDSIDEEYTEDYCDLDENLLKKWSKLILDNIYDGIRVSSLGYTLLEIAEVKI